VSNSTAQNPSLTLTTIAPAPLDSAKELLSLKTKINQLRSTIAKAVATIIKAIASIQHPHQQPTPIAMETKEDSTNSTNLTEPTPSKPLDLTATINELKIEIAAITTKFRTTLHSLIPQQVTTTPYSQSVK